MSCCPQHDLSLGDVGFARRLNDDRALSDAVESWLEAAPSRPADVPVSDWLRFEQEKHERLLAKASEQLTATP